MAREYEPIFAWDPDEGVATCIITDGHHEYCGFARCKEEDQDMKSEKTGCYIAEGRARINYLTHLRDEQIKPRLSAYNELYYSINQSERFNPESYEVHMLQKKIKDTRFELEAVRDMISSEKKTLNEYMRQKAILYKKVRDNRQADKSN